GPRGSPASARSQRQGYGSRRTAPAVSSRPMPVDFDAARAFVYANARLVETRLFATLFEGADPAGVARAVEAYRNEDGGYGHALEPDKRCPASQPEDVIFALELLALAGVDGTEIATTACTFLEGVADESGAVPLALR